MSGSAIILLEPNWSRDINFERAGGTKIKGHGLYNNVVMASSLPAEKLGELRQLIHGHISEAGVQEQIRTAISEILSQHGGR